MRTAELHVAGLVLIATCAAHAQTGSEANTPERLDDCRALASRGGLQGAARTAFLGECAAAAALPAPPAPASTASWVPGAAHPQRPNVEASEKEGVWAPSPGYTWQADPPNGDFSVRWSPGAIHPLYPKLVAQEKEKDWNAVKGYAFLNDAPGDLRVKRVPGTKHPTAPHVRNTGPNSWEPEPGYSWVDASAGNDMRVVWKPGLKHPEFTHVIAGEKEGQFVTEAGWKWLNGTDGDFRVSRK